MPELKLPEGVQPTGQYRSERRDAEAYREATTDPVFLGQSRRWRCSDHQGYESERCESCIEIWVTEGWRVYCVPALGTLAQILRETEL